MSSPSVYSLLYPFQKQAIDKLSHLSSAGLFFDMGLGKTITACAWLENKLQTHPTKFKKIFIVCQAIKCFDWVLEIKKYACFNHLPITRCNKTKTNVQVITQAQEGIFIISHNMWAQLQKHVKQLSPPHSCLLCFDECQATKNISSKTSKTTLAFCQYHQWQNTLFLSGSIVSNKYTDLFVPLTCIGISFGGSNVWTNFQAFKNHFCCCKNIQLSSGREVNVVVGYKNIAELIALVNLHAVCIKKAEVLPQLPMQTFKLCHLEQDRILVLQQLKKLMYQSIPLLLHNNLEQIDAFKVNHQDNPLVKLFPIAPTDMLRYERQLCSGFLSNQQVLDFVPMVVATPKLEMLKSLMMQSSGNLLVFYNFNMELQQIKNMVVNEFSNNTWEIVEINGQHKWEEQQALLYDAEGKVKNNLLILGQYQSMSTGLNLQDFGSEIVYYSPCLSSELNIQSQNRIHRIGTTKPCVYYQFCVVGSVEEAIWENLAKYADFNDKLYLNYYEQKEKLDKKVFEKVV